MEFNRIPETSGQIPATTSLCLPITSTIRVRPGNERCIMGRILISFRDLGGYGEVKQFDDIVAAAEFARLCLGLDYEFGEMDMISGDGIGRLTVLGCTIRELDAEVRKIF